MLSPPEPSPAMIASNNAVLTTHTYVRTCLSRREKGRVVTCKQVDTVSRVDSVLEPPTSDNITPLRPTGDVCKVINVWTREANEKG